MATAAVVETGGGTDGLNNYVAYIQKHSDLDSCRDHGHLDHWFRGVKYERPIEFPREFIT
jgi:hypothetical protein